MLPFKIPYDLLSGYLNIIQLIKVIIFLVILLDLLCVSYAMEVLKYQYCTQPLVRIVILKFLNFYCFQSEFLT